MKEIREHREKEERDSAENKFLYSLKDILSPIVYEKLLKVARQLRSYERVVIAYSGGVDSTTLLGVAYKVLGKQVLPVLVVSPTLPRAELEEARKGATELGVLLHEISRNELEMPDFVENSKERCYVCKKGRFEELVAWSKERGFFYVLDGSNVDDLGDYRPGMKALDELDEVKSPWLMGGLTKNEIREIAKALGLSVWNKPSSPCLATRVPYGDPLTEEVLKRIELGEELLKRYLSYPFRLRDHRGLGRIEVNVLDMPFFLEDNIRNEILYRLYDIGFEYVCIDIEPFESGRMNRGIKDVEEK